ncbi:hypothetical protein I2492_15560 [Budviciaceae bacterium CWB-B4]|uniref:Uncharacterized protein n=1 Tax=Limnobaculum xujianqingii TaxID=2738837 RepID=A0A9D7FVI6_9GAMM|nr:hypothetical protein [Limnobaculum xujianqingii]MBK5074596.1 hypothetical protein [Limnobaculum xujianqingii]MBK5177738.1 hypothetical protein [Limnobaculum xujianqingii]
MAIDYPDWIPLPQKANKNMTFDTGFRTDQPQVGAPIFQRLTDDLKTTWTLTWIFELAEERAFQLWLRSPSYLDNCNQWFKMPLNIGGSGLQMQELHFTEFPVQSSINGASVTWTGNVIVKKLYNSDDDYSDIIVELPPPWASWLDIIVTGYPDDRDPESLPRYP